jgi:hypothetical protein
MKKICVSVMAALLAYIVFVGMLSFVVIIRTAEAAAPLPPLDSQAAPGDLATLINQYRQQQGLPPLVITASVTCVASQVAADRAAAGQPGTHNASLTFSLFSSCGAGNFVGEIAAGNGAGTSAAATLQQFVNSSEHWAIIVGGGNSLGCGYATGTYLGFAGFQSWTCDFATVSGVQPQPNPQPGPNPVPVPNPQPGPCLPPLCGSTGGGGGTPSPAPQPACLPPLCGSTGFTTPSGGSGTGGVVQCIPPLCGSTIPVVPSSGSPASTGGNSSSGGAPASTLPGGTSTSGGAVAGTGTVCLPPTCASTGR